MLRKLTTMFLGMLALTGTAQNALPVVQSCNDFAFQVFKQESGLKPASNYSYSPLSLNIALRMLAAGAGMNTLEQIKKLAAFDEDPLFIHSNIKDILSQITADTALQNSLVIANGMWVQKEFPVSRDFIQIVANLYHSGYNAADFTTPVGRDKSKNEVNKWVMSETNGKIKNLTDDKTFNPNTKLVLVNAMYFKALWQRPFDKQLTQTGDFTNLNGKIQKGLFMQQTNSFNYLGSPDFQAIDIPYANQFSLLVILPGPDRFNKVESRMNSQWLDSIINNLEPETIELRLPKLRIESTDDYAEPLKMLGMQDAFGNRADFSGISGNKELFVSKIIQKSYVEIDERGTEAAAATAIVMSRKMGVVGNLVFNANRPFIYLIRDRQTGIILFMGKYVSVN
jgi:serpin B